METDAFRYIRKHGQTMLAKGRRFMISVFVLDAMDERGDVFLTDVCGEELGVGETGSLEQYC